MEITDFVFEPALGAWTRTVLLRAERVGSMRGRVYTVAVAVMDGSGNVGASSSAVIVPGVSPPRGTTAPAR